MPLLHKINTLVGISDSLCLFNEHGIITFSISFSGGNTACACSMDVIMNLPLSILAKLLFHGTVEVPENSQRFFKDFALTLQLLQFRYF